MLEERTCQPSWKSVHEELLPNVEGFPMSVIDVHEDYHHGKAEEKHDSVTVHDDSNGKI